jgi:hypothetical protein
MAEAPNIFILLLLTSTIEGFKGLCYFIDLYLATIFLAWAYNESHQFSTKASKFDKSLQVQLQQQSFKPTRIIYSYHSFKARMKLKKKRKFIKPPPLFYLTRKWKIIKMILFMFLIILKVGLCVEYLISSTLPHIWCLKEFFHSLPFIIIQCFQHYQIKQNAQYLAFLSVTDSAVPDPIQ